MDRHTEQRVTAICNLGCDRVREVMQALRQGRQVNELAGDSPQQCEVVLQELESIMAVYDGKQAKRPS